MVQKRKSVKPADARKTAGRQELLPKLSWRDDLDTLDFFEIQQIAIAGYETIRVDGQGQPEDGEILRVSAGDIIARWRVYHTAGGHQPSVEISSLLRRQL